MSLGLAVPLVRNKHSSMERGRAWSPPRLPAWRRPPGNQHTVFLCAPDSGTNGLKLVASSLATGSGLNQNNHFKKR